VLKTQDGKGMALSSFEGKSNVVLFFYPKVRLRLKESVSFKSFI
jgi:peroxiredoxin